MEVLLVFSYIVRFLPIILHCSGIYILIKDKRYISATQKILLQNLSVSEILLSSVSILGFIIKDVHGLQSIERRCVLVVFFVINALYFVIMATLTLDRFVEVYMNIKYPIYWSARKMKLLMACEWMLAFLGAVFSLAIVLVGSMRMTAYLLGGRPR
ncbi:olfactory receptor 1B1-like [Hydractinia symbiolongicarpus]|uniref:olfactory receptor 1B1-like n=1 Tax=Hydractinia symbiolongicarpus TaxID=13093 RepID=UPI00254F6F07|nr:olfactory receptor 1B1-like [Hydractinia symbiolongicarpus]